MSINKVLLSGLLACSLSACSRDLFISHNGNMPTNERIEQVKVGQSKNQVKSILGSPSSVVSLDKNTWIYMSSDIERIAFLEPKEVSRDVLTIKFDEENNVIDIDRMSQKDGKQVAINEDKTETMGQQQGFFRRFFGGVGSYMPFPKSLSHSSSPADAGFFLHQAILMDFESILISCCKKSTIKSFLFRISIFFRHIFL